MNILVFDTCLDKMYVALANDNKILSSKIVENRDNKYHSAFLISTIKQILKENDLSPKDIDVIGTNVGPGSFTGIRACTTVARMMAQQLMVQAVGVSSLEILSKLAPEAQMPLVALDARKNCAYLYLEGEVKGAIELDKVEDIIKNNNYFVITDNKLLSRLGGVSYQNCEYPLGDILARLVYERVCQKNFNWQDLKPLYIQPPPMG